MSDVDDLLAFITASPSPYHAVAEGRRRLEAHGFTALDPADAWPAGPGRHLVAQGGALVAWVVPDGVDPWTPFRVVGAHTDSPTLRIKPRPDTGAAGWQQLAVEVYGGALWNSWLDRDLGLSGRVVVAGAPAPLLIRVDDPLLRIPQLAIHLDREANSGLKLNPQQHLTPVWGVGPVADGDFRAFLAEVLATQHPEHAGASILGWDLMVHDLTAPTRLGRRGELVAAPRLDNLLSCWAGLVALLDAADTAPEGAIPVLCLYDHEEIGSTSSTGADGVLLAHLLERIVVARGGTRQDHLRALAGSLCVSADGAHATHPNYPDRHEPGHHVAIDGGPVIKINANQRYATDGTTAATLVAWCEAAKVPHQVFVGRNDQPCGSTIGPLTAARLGMATVDVGVAQLSMHSARELCGAEDPGRLAQLLAVVFGRSVPSP